MQSSYELSTLVANSIYVKNIDVKNYFAYSENDDSSGVRYSTDVKSAGFWSQFEASCVSSYIDKLWYNKTVCLLVHCGV